MTPSTPLDRRAFMGAFTSIGLGASLLPGVLWAQAQQTQAPEITKEMIANAEEIAGIKLTDEERTAITRNLQQARNNIQQLHQIPLDASVFPAFVFDPVPPGEQLPPKMEAKPVRSRVPMMTRPGSLDELAFAPVTQLSELVRARKVKPSELTEMYLSRLKRYDPQLHCVISLAALAQGDRWYAERTRNPWNVETGSSGSSAGPASATAAGCVAFGIGSETNGSITSPSRTCGVSGFRPTFGRVPRTGAMALSWTMDKLGPMCRGAEDCALVFDAIQGPDGFDYSVKRYPFNWNAQTKPSQLRIAFVKSRFEGTRQDGTPFRNEEALNVLKVLGELGAKLTAIEDPTPTSGFLAQLTLNAECGAAFEGDTLNANIKELEPYSTWPNTFRAAQFLPAVDYVNAQRARTKLCKQWWDLFREHDVILTPQENTSVTNITGTPSIVVPTGFAIPQPQSFARGGRGGAVAGAGAGAGGAPTASAASAGRGDSARPAAPATPSAPAVSTIPLPTWIYMMGPIYQDEKILAVAHAFQQATEFHRKRPPAFT